jgi:flagellar motor switch protein FliG
MALSELDYGKLSRQQKLAIFLIIIGPEAAAEVLRQFDDAEIELICREMSTFTVVPSEVQKLSLEEFSSLIAKSVSTALGGLGYAQRTLEIAKGDYKASTIVGRIGPVVGTSVEVIKDISEMEGRQIFNLVKHEQPQTISFLLSYLDSAKSAEVFALLGPDLREEVIERLGTIESTSLELVSKIARSLGKHYDTKVRPAFHRSGGVRAVADLLNQLDKEMSKNLLARLEERNATLSAAIRKKLFSFEDLLRLQPADLQRVLREVDSANLAIAMKSASETLRERIYGSISKRAAETLKEELEMLGPVRLKDVEAAQDAIIQVVRRLEEEGQITLEADASQSVVA